ncbi:MAG: hypothetical protein JXA21_28480 [Anaerolineae bacterium]|nr:hypothetical protein [Anaerolineae bacterium]
MLSIKQHYTLNATGDQDQTLKKCTTLRHPGREIGRRGANGPYTLTGLLVAGPLGIALIKLLLGTTQPYHYIAAPGSRPGAHGAMDMVTTLSSPVRV